MCVDAGRTPFIIHGCVCGGTFVIHPRCAAPTHKYEFAPCACMRCYFIPSNLLVHTCAHFALNLSLWNFDGFIRRIEIILQILSQKSLILLFDTALCNKW
jgi:hypothetical protein